MILLAADGQNCGTSTAWEWLKMGHTALAAIEQGIRLVEANPSDSSVGLGGLPNALGQVELDAGVMDGRTRESGAVGALRGFLHPVSVAYAVMQTLPHVLLVGEGAARFAAEIGAEREDAAQALLTPESAQRWREWCEKVGFTPDEIQDHLSEAVTRGLGTGGKKLPQKGGTTVYLAQDGAGNLAAATSTSGWAWKYPGRLGDSPIAGAGFYADNRFGAAACTGVGELSIRTSLARNAVAKLEAGLEVEAAIRSALQDLRYLPGLEQPERIYGITLYAIDAHQGFAAGFLPTPGWNSQPYYAAVDGDAQPQRFEAFRVE